MDSYQTFTTSRATEPDLPSLIAALRTQDATAGVQHFAASPTYVVKKNTAWTAPQIAFAQNVLDTVTETTPALLYSRTSHGRDMLATVALVVRAKNLAAWNALTLPQKVAAAQAEADVWVGIRDFLETAGV